MDAEDRKAHWENIYSTKALSEVSWYQPTPETSIRLIGETCVSKEAKIIDVGGGDSFLVDHLLELGYTNLTVLDISSTALERAKKRLGKKATLVKWVISDITKFEANEIYDVWHDRAAFHFLTAANEIKDYTIKLNSYTNETAHLIIGTFSKEGPTKCSGIEITQYSETSLQEVFTQDWEQTKNLNVFHRTPFKTEQAFVFSVFSKRG